MTVDMRYADIGNSASMLLCRADIPIYRYIGIIGKKVTADMPICRYRQFGKYAIMPCRYSNIDNMQICRYAVPICRYLGISA